MIDEILARYPAMAGGAVTEEAGDWFQAANLSDTHRDHRRFKFRTALDRATLDRFRDHYLSGIGIELTDYAIGKEQILKAQPFQKFDYDKVIFSKVFSDQLQAEFDAALSKLEPGQGPIFLQAVEDAIDCGGAKGVCAADGRLIVCSRFSIRMAARAVRTVSMLQTLDRMPETILELGGGFGKTLADLMLWSGAATAIYIDMPLNMALAARYLDALFPGRVNLVWSAEDRLQDTKINILAPWLLVEKMDRGVDLMINFLALQHMQPASQAYYFDALVRGRVRHLYHENRLDPRDDIEGALRTSAFRAEGEIVASRVVDVPWFVNANGEAVQNEALAIQSELIRY
jgi:putative sugar O-methyltransferase